MTTSLSVFLVFFPVLRQKHIYLIVINLKKPDFEVINNSADDADFDDKYGSYLKEINHVKANEMADKNLIPVRLIMKWRTVYNKMDCVILEKNVLNGNVVFQNKVFLKKKSVKKLRMKYAATILTSEINTKCDDMLKVAYEYQKVDPKICFKHSYHAQWNIETSTDYMLFICNH
uniref:Uncharacterized protein n=1 Tax=Lactuca sativa TaxID=4236 RepID=A0A9R1WQB4_LACSA|nr:hypothetical protein LSAT_V11C100009680 [Lactuca sativa]